MNVLIVHDGSEYSDAILKDLQYAGLPPHSSVTALSVVGATFEEYSPSLLNGRSARTTTLRPQTEAHYVKTILAQHFPDWYVEADVLRGNASQEILRFAEERHVELIVMGSHGRIGSNRALMGSVSATVAGQAACNVRIVHPRHKHCDQPLRVLLCLDDPRTATQTVNAVLARQFPRNTRVHLLHVLESTPMLTRMSSFPTASDVEELQPADLRGAHAMLDYYKGEIAQRYHTIETQIRYGDPSVGILHYAQLEEIDAIYLGAESHGSIDRHRFGSVAHRVIQNAETTVEIVRR